MPDQIIINIVRPDVGIEYIAESQEAELPDRLAACYLGMHALARHVRGLHAALGTPCPAVVEKLAESDAWMHGMR
jgi:hypothetical protein